VFSYLYQCNLYSLAAHLLQLQIHCRQNQQGCVTCMVYVPCISLKFTVETVRTTHGHKYYPIRPKIPDEHGNGNNTVKNVIPQGPKFLNNFTTATVIATHKVTNINPWGPKSFNSVTMVTFITTYTVPIVIINKKFLKEPSAYFRCMRLRSLNVHHFGMI
jgi:hypothetical protein